MEDGGVGPPAGGAAVGGGAGPPAGGAAVVGGVVPPAGGAAVVGGAAVRKVFVVRNMGKETLAVLVPNEFCGFIKKCVNVDLHAEGFVEGDVATGLSSYGLQDKSQDTITYRVGTIEGEMAVEKDGRLAVASGEAGAARCGIVKVVGRCFAGTPTGPELLKAVITVWFLVGTGKFSLAKHEKIPPEDLFNDAVFNAVKGGTTFQATLLCPKSLGGALVVRVVGSVPVQVFVAGRLFSDGWCGDVADVGCINERLQHRDTSKRLFLLSPIAEMVKKGGRGGQGNTGAD